MQEQTIKLTEKELINKLVPVYREIDNLNADAKVLLAEAKEAGYDAAMLAKVSKAIAGSKLEELEGKTQQLLEFISDNT